MLPFLDNGVNFAAMLVCKCLMDWVANPGAKFVTAVSFVTACFFDLISSILTTE